MFLSSSSAACLSSSIIFPCQLCFDFPSKSSDIFPSKSLDIFQSHSIQLFSRFSLSFACSLNFSLSLSLSLSSNSFSLCHRPHPPQLFSVWLSAKKKNWTKIKSSELKFYFLCEFIHWFVFSLREDIFFASRCPCYYYLSPSLSLSLSIYIYIYIYICMCVCVSECLSHWF